MIYKNWAFRLFVYTVILNVLVMIMVIQSSIFNPFTLQILVLSLLATLTCFTGIVFGIISYAKKEETDYKKRVGLIGNLIILFSGIILSFFQ